MQTVTINDIFDAFIVKCREKISRIEPHIYPVTKGRESEIPACFEKMKKQNLSYMIDKDLVFTNEYRCEPEPTQLLTFLDVNKTCILSIKIYYRYKDEDEPASICNCNRTLARMHTYCDR